MDRCSRWFYSGVALAREEAAPAPVAERGVSSRTPDARDRCPVCGMLVACNPGWTAHVVLDDDTTLFFDGANDLFVYLLSLRLSTAPAIAGVFVRSFGDGRVIDAHDALFVVGSDVLGPNGAELVPHPTRADAHEFARRHGGGAVLGFDEVRPELISGLRADPGEAS